MISKFGLLTPAIALVPKIEGVSLINCQSCTLLIILLLTTKFSNFVPLHPHVQDGIPSLYSLECPPSSTLFDSTPLYGVNIII